MQRISDLIFFGDSLTDQRVMHDLTSRTAIVTIPVQSAGYGRAFTNGAVHAEVLTGLLGVSAQNYAVGGAQAVGRTTLKDYVATRLEGQIPGLDVFQPDARPRDLNFDIDFGGQIGRFLADARRAPPEPDTAAGFFIGLNDYASFTPTSPERAQEEAAELLAKVIASTVAGAAAAVAAGVETVLLYTMPSFRFFPLSTLQTPEMLALGDQLIAAHNAALARSGAVLEALGAEVEYIDLNRISAEIRADPATFDLDAALFGAPALLGTGGNPRLIEGPGGEIRAVFAHNPAVAGVDIDRLGFIDFVHPTETVHAVWGVFSAETLTSRTIFRGGGDDHILGTRRADLILAGAGNDRVAALGGDDVVLAGRGADLVSAGSGDDIVAGGAGRDRLFGGWGADLLAGGAGDDEVRGGGGGDLLVVGPGRDRLYGDSGNDAFLFLDPTLAGGEIEDPGARLWGGSGRDTLYLVLDAATRQSVEEDGVGAVGLTLRGVERIVLLDPEEGLDGIDTAARLDEGALWGFV